MRARAERMAMGGRPYVCVTMGDPAGIGPEIAVKAIAPGGLLGCCMPFVVGDCGVIREAAGFMADGPGGAPGPGRVTVRAIRDPADGDYAAGVVNVMEACRGGRPGTGRLRMGEATAEAGAMGLACIREAAGLALSGKADAVATAPVNKRAMRLVDGRFIGHTEELARIAGVPDARTMFQVGPLRIFFLTRHVSLREACGAVTKANVMKGIEDCSEALAGLAGVSPSLAVAGLNPHSGDGGLFGVEELREIEPAVSEMRRRGYDVHGPVPADSVFHLAEVGRYGAVLALYHDQGHIAAKALGFSRTVSVTLGLPFVRTSVDHGTAYDIAGKGMADEGSMFEAIKVAAGYASGAKGAAGRAVTRR